MAIFSNAISTARNALRTLISNDDFHALRTLFDDEYVDIIVDTTVPDRIDLTVGYFEDDYTIDPLTQLFTELLQSVLYELSTKIDFVRLDGCTDYFINGYIVRLDYNPDNATA